MAQDPLMRPSFPFLHRGGFQNLLLRTLRDKPMYGYEVIKALEERFQGFYRPSAGAVYPALRSLRTKGLVAVSGAEGHKTYRLTTKGKAVLRSQRAAVQKQFRSFAAAVGPDKAALLREMRSTGRLLTGSLRTLTPQQARHLRAAVSQLRAQIANILSESTEAVHD